MGYELREFAEVGKLVARENNEVDRKHVMPEREGRRGECLQNISNATGNYELFSCHFRSGEH